MNEILPALSAAPTFAILGFGFLLGLRHATDADHLAAIATMASDRRNLWSSALVGGLWGLGHTVSLIAAGVFVLLLDFQISSATERRLEIGVGIMLTLLGLNVFRKLVNGGHLHFHSHEHGERAHAHPHIHEISEAAHAAAHHGFEISPRAIAIGMVHGLAGSAALMLLVIPTIESRIVGLLYITVFGIGSLGGMVIMSFLIGLPFHFTAVRLSRFNHVLQICAGAVSIGLGLWIVYEKGFSQGLIS